MLIRAPLIFDCTPSVPVARAPLTWAWGGVTVAAAAGAVGAAFSDPAGPGPVMLISGPPKSGEGMVNVDGLLAGNFFRASPGCGPETVLESSPSVAQECGAASGVAASEVVDCRPETPLRSPPSVAQECGAASGVAASEMVDCRPEAALESPPSVGQE